MKRCWRTSSWSAFMLTLLDAKLECLPSKELLGSPSFRRAKNDAFQDSLHLPIVSRPLVNTSFITWSRVHMILYDTAMCSLLCVPRHSFLSRREACGSVDTTKSGALSIDATFWDSKLSEIIKRFLDLLLLITLQATKSLVASIRKMWVNKELKMIYLWPNRAHDITTPDSNHFTCVVHSSLRIHFSYIISVPPRANWSKEKILLDLVS